MSGNLAEETDIFDSNYKEKASRETVGILFDFAQRPSTKTQVLSAGIGVFFLQLYTWTSRAVGGGRGELREGDSFCSVTCIAWR